MATDHPLIEVRRKAILIVLCVVAIGLFVLAGLTFDTSSDEDVTVTGGSVIEEQFPAEGDSVLRQSLVGIDLAPGWEAEMTLNGTPLPLDEVNKIEGLARFEFQPGDGKAVETLQGGRNCMVASIWNVGQGIANSQRTVTWCFEAA